MNKECSVSTGQTWALGPGVESIPTEPESEGRLISGEKPRVSYRIEGKLALKAHNNRCPL